MPYPTFLVASLQRTHKMLRIVQGVLCGREHHNVCQILVRVNPSKDKQTIPPASACCVSKSTHRSRKHTWCGPFSGPHVVQMEVISHKGPPERNKAKQGATQAGEEVRFYPFKFESTVSTHTPRRRGFLMSLLPYCCSNKPQAWQKTSTKQLIASRTPPLLCNQSHLPVPTTVNHHDSSVFQETS